ncbi:MAG: CinA family protein [Eubacteriales bacterium]
MENLRYEIIELLRLKNLTLASAESCTGGLISKMITDVAGCSDVFEGGVVSYSNDVKMKLLGVKAETLEKHGAVSGETAKEMALGVRRACMADIGISTTGIAGPTGGTAEKPVGTVYIGISFGDICESELLSINPEYSREKIRNVAAQKILELLYKKIKENY